MAIKVIEVDEDDTSGFADEVLQQTRSGKTPGCYDVETLIHPSFHRVFHPFFRGVGFRKFHVKHDVSLIADVFFRVSHLIHIYIYMSCHIQQS